MPTNETSWAKVRDAPDEFDFSVGVRGKYAARMAEGSNVVVLDSDVADVFPDSASVNHALRLLVQLARGQVREHVLADGKSEYKTE